MPEESYQERTEQATPKRREEARQKGHVAKSVELNSAFVLLAWILMLYALSGSWLMGLASQWRRYFGSLSRVSITPDSVEGVLGTALLDLARFLAPALGVLLGAAVLANLAQVGFVFSGEPLVPKMERINPVQGARRLLSTRSLVELVKGLLKLLLVGWIVYGVLKGEKERILLLADQSPLQILSFIAAVSFKVGLRASLVLLALALADYGYQRFEYERSLRMTRQELKEELKQTEGDPLIKARIRSIQRALARRRMMKRVPESDVVITNPTELAVALKYDPKTMNAPTVVAKGARKLAQRIKEIAQAHGVPIVENKPLAQLLYRSVDIGMEIPVEAYQAVAEVLAYVYRLKGKVR
ncbi:MAG: flagellar biosynthesis protein FlhB [candidate division KSB1 bacterium]|nr:flagellar biosynthesis protein FlhB [candidate division KSB1 bacterium]